MVPYKLPISQHEYLDERGRSPFRRWLEDLSDAALAKVTRALERLAQGNVSNVKSVGAGVHELRIDFGPGYRVYFAWDGTAFVILLGGGSKARQQDDIAAARARLKNYKRRKGN